jgi:hypothetical protein
MPVCPGRRGADDGNRTRVFSLGSYSQPRTCVLYGLVKRPGVLTQMPRAPVVSVRSAYGCSTAAAPVRFGRAGVQAGYRVRPSG